MTGMAAQQQDDERPPRLAAIAHIDVAGYSEHMARDERRTYAIVKRYHLEVISPEARRRGGRVVNRSGDDWLLVFPDSDEALAFALVVQRRLAVETMGRASVEDLRLRVGVNLGEVHLDGDSVFGSDVNVAARLQSIAKPGGVNLSHRARAALRRDPDCELRDIGPRAVRNIPEPITVHRAVLEVEDADAPLPESRVIDLHRPVRGTDRRGAIAVLPFRSAGDEAQEAFADGLTEDVIDGLSHMRWFPVIARNSVFAFKGRDADVAEVGERLGARYVLTGSVRRAGARMRVAVRLEDAQDRTTLWSQRLDRQVADVFDTLDELARSVVGAIEPELTRAESGRAARTADESLGEWDRINRGKWHLNRLTREDAAAAWAIFEEVLLGNPDSVEAHVQMAWWRLWDVWTQRGATEGLLEMERHARRAMALDPRDARGSMLAGIALLMQGDHGEAREILRRAVALNPSLAAAHASIASTLYLSGEPELALEHIDTALRLSPNDIHTFHALGERAMALYMTGDHVEAVATATESLRRRPRYVYAHMVRIGALARLGRAEEAEAALARLLEARPDFSLEQVRWLPFTDRHWIGYITKGLDLAGFRPQD